MDSSFVKKNFLLISNRMKIGPTLDQKRKIALHHFNVGLMFILLEMCRKFFLEKKNASMTT